MCQVQKEWMRLMASDEIDGAVGEVVREVFVFDWQRISLNIKCIVEVGQNLRAIKALKLVKATCEWMKVFPASNMPLADQTRRVTGFSHHVGDGCFVRAQSSQFGKLVHVQRHNTRAMRVPSR